MKWVRTQTSQSQSRQGKHPLTPENSKTNKNRIRFLYNTCSLRDRSLLFSRALCLPTLLPSLLTLLFASCRYHTYSYDTFKYSSPSPRLGTLLLLFYYCYCTREAKKCIVCVTCALSLNCHVNTIAVNTFIPQT